MHEFSELTVSVEPIERVGRVSTGERKERLYPQEPRLIRELSLFSAPRIDALSMRRGVLTVFVQLFQLLPTRNTWSTCCETSHDGR